MTEGAVQRQRKTKDPCPGCALHKVRCICAVIPSLDLKTKVTLIIHARELKRTTNTGTLALKALVNSEMRVRGREHSRADHSDLLSPAYETYILFPSEDALDLEEISPRKPVQLIVADGNWRQAAKVNHRYPEFGSIPRVKINHRNEATEHLRKEHFESGMSTLEAIARALKIIEGEEVGRILLGLYDAKLRATLSGRGRLK